MTIDGAILLLMSSPKWLTHNASMDYLTALRLGVEALKQIKDVQSGEIIDADVVLPGQTKD